MARGNGDLIAALDVGTCKVCCLLARDDGERGLRVIGVGHQVSEGLRAGRVADMEAVEGSILSAVHAAERMADETIHRVFVNISGGAPTSHRFELEVATSGHEVGEGDLRRLFEQAQARFQSDEREIVHALPTAYVLDGAGGIRDPRGMYGERLGAEIHLVSVASSALRTLQTCIGRCHLDPMAPIVSPYASGLACLVDDEMSLGVTVVDMGGGTTGIAVFYEGEMVATTTIPIGGIHVTNDIARGLSTSKAHAERMKTLMGSVVPTLRDEREVIEVPPLGENDDTGGTSVPKSTLVAIIRPRIEETLELVRDQLNSNGFGRLGGRRVVLTGGASQLQGVQELAGQILGKQVRVGRPIHVPGLAEVTGGPAFSTAAGLLIYATQKHPQNIHGATSGAEGAIGQLARIGQWLRENF